MQLSTPVKLPEPPFAIDLGARFLSLGSCFADRVGQKLAEALFPITVNPTGIHYNPVSLSRCLWPKVEQPEFLLHNGLWRSLQHHSKLSDPNYQRACQIATRAEQCRVQALETADVLLLTLGTALVWETVASGSLVANCHRLDSSLFQRRRLDLVEAVDALQRPLQNWLEASASRSVILTVSPVRYLRDGLVENSRGKSVLLLCCEELERLHSRIVYFPSYEIFLDELRDYRYYADDLLQPSSLGVNFVWEAFCRTFFKEETQRKMAKVERVQKLAKHRLTAHSKPQELARKGLKLLDELERAGAELASLELRAHFQRWLCSKK